MIIRMKELMRKLIKFQERLSNRILRRGIWELNLYLLKRKRLNLSLMDCNQISSPELLNALTKRIRLPFRSFMLGHLNQSLNLLTTQLVSLESKSNYRPTVLDLLLYTIPNNNQNSNLVSSIRANPVSI